MNPVLGWTLLSKDALGKAEQQLYGDGQGILDEIGFRTLHQAYADRFFPGTSVLHTRLRYALFIPWIYERAMRERGGTLARRIANQENSLTARLKAAEPTGVIGSRIHPAAAVQSASMSYWGALGKWGILRPNPDGSIPSRTAVHRRARPAGPAHYFHDDDENPLEEDNALFIALPPIPKGWDNPATPLDFFLPKNERTFFRQRWMTLKRLDGKPALLAQIVSSDADVAGARWPWSSSIREVADPEDRAALVRARKVSALAAIGRAIYAALVETLREDEDRLPTTRECRDRCGQVVAEYRSQAADLDLAALEADLPPSPARGLILRVLDETQGWTARGRGDIRQLLDCYRHAEIARKGPRARLPLIKAARERRLAWKAADTPAEPLHYRWAQVKTLLLDLQPPRI